MISDDGIDDGIRVVSPKGLSDIFEEEVGLVLVRVQNRSLALFELTNQDENSSTIFYILGL